MKNSFGQGEFFVHLTFDFSTTRVFLLGTVAVFLWSYNFGAKWRKCHWHNEAISIIFPGNIFPIELQCVLSALIDLIEMWIDRVTYATIPCIGTVDYHDI